MKARHVKYKKIVQFRVENKISILNSKSDCAQLRTNGSNRLICQILSITRHRTSRYELVSEHDTLDLLYNARDMILLVKSIPFIPMETIRKSLYEQLLE